MSNEFIIKALKFNQDDYLNFLMQKVRDLRSGEIDYGEVEQEIRKDLGSATFYLGPPFNSNQLQPELCGAPGGLKKWEGGMVSSPLLVVSSRP